MSLPVQAGQVFEDGKWKPLQGSETMFSFDDIVKNEIGCFSVLLVICIIIDRYFMCRINNNLHYIAMLFIGISALIKTRLSTIGAQINDDNNMLLSYGIISIISIVIYYYSDKWTSLYSSNKQLEYIEEQWNKYVSLNKQSRDKDTVKNFSEKVSRAQWSVSSKLIYGLHVFLELGANLTGFYYIIMKHKQYMIIGMFISIYVIYYYIVSKDKMKLLFEKRINNRKIRSSINDICNLLELRLHNDECKVSDLMIKRRVIEEMDNEVQAKWSEFHKIQLLPINIIIIMIYYYVDPALYLVMYLVSIQLSGSIQSLLGFLNDYQKINDEIKNVEEFWNGKSFDNEPVQKNIPSTLSVLGLINDKVSIVGKLLINQGDKILISGASASGKTTLIKGLIGYMKGAIYDSNDEPLSYRKKISYMCQDMREQILISRNTLRQIFYDETDNDLIIEVLKTVHLEKWFTNTMKSDLDEVLEMKVAGGEKSRLCLAITLYKARKDNCQWLILDEPDAGLDNELAPELLKSVITNYADMTIFLIVHVCECKIPMLGIKKQFNVRDLRVEQILFS